MTAAYAFAILVAQASVTGTILSEKGPVAAITVSFDAPGGVSTEVVTDEKGNFSLTGLAPGGYLLRMALEKRLMMIPSVFLEAGDNRLTLYWPPVLTKAERDANLKAAFTTGSADLAAGRYTEAAERFEEALIADTSQAPVWAALALAQAGAKRFEDALHSGMMAIRFAPDAAAYRNNVGSTLFRLGRYDEAVRRYREAAERNPEGRGIYLSNAAAALVAIGKDSEAVEAYREALTDPNVPVSSWFYYGALLQRGGRPADAKAALQRYLEKEPNGRFAEDARARLRSLGSEPPKV